MSSSPRMIVELNIKRFRDLLKIEMDPARRQTLVNLLDEHEAELSKLGQQSGNAAEH